MSKLLYFVLFINWLNICWKLRSINFQRCSKKYINHNLSPLYSSNVDGFSTFFSPAHSAENLLFSHFSIMIRYSCLLLQN